MAFAQKSPNASTPSSQKWPLYTPLFKSLQLWPPGGADIVRRNDELGAVQRSAFLEKLRTKSPPICPPLPKP